MESIRDQRCYICGNVFNSSSPAPVAAILDKRIRQVHKTCKNQHAKAMDQLSWMKEVE